MSAAPASAANATDCKQRLRADPSLLAAGAALLRKMTAESAPPPPAAPTAAPVPDARIRTILGKLADKDFQSVLERLSQLMYCAGDASVPRGDCMRLLFDHLMNAQLHSVGEAMRMLAHNNKPSEFQLVRALWTYYPDAWASYVSKEEAEQAEEMEDKGADYEPIDMAGKGRDDEEEEDEIEPRSDENERGDASAGGGSSSSGSGAAAQHAARMRFADERTAEMNAAEYEEWRAMNLPPHHPVLTCLLPLVPRGRYEEWRAIREQRSSKRLAAFGRLSALNVHDLVGIRKAGETQDNRLIKFLAKLWSDRLTEVVEAANREAHGGALTIRTEAIGRCHYEHACAGFAQKDADVVRERAQKAEAARKAARAAEAARSAEVERRAVEERESKRAKLSALHQVEGPWAAAAASAVASGQTGRW